MTGDESRVLRGRLAALEAAVARLDSGCPPCTLSKTVKTVAVSSYPTAAGRWFGVQEQTVTGVESEGGTPATTAVGPTFYATIAGTIPPVGTTLIVELIDGRWQGRYDG